MAIARVSIFRDGVARTTAVASSTIKAVLKTEEDSAAAAAASQAAGNSAAEVTPDTTDVAPNGDAASSATGSAPGAGGPPASTESSTGQSDAPQAQTVATQPGRHYIAAGIVLAVLGFGGGWLLQRHFHPQLSNLPVIATGFGSVTLIYIMAQSLERILVPVSWFAGGVFGIDGDRPPLTTKSALKKDMQSAQVKAARLQAGPTSVNTAAAVAQDNANSKHNLDQYEANLTAITFGLSAGLASLVCGYAGIFLLKTVGVSTAPWLDLLVTGLVIAGGTKPLHDLISNISSSSQAKSAAT